MAYWTSVAKSFDGAVSHLRTLFKQQEFDDLKSEGDSDDQTEIIQEQGSAAVKRRTGTGEIKTATKKNCRNDRTSPPQPQLLIDQEIRPLFDTLHESYATLEYLALECRERAAHDQALFQRFDDFLGQLVCSSFIVVKHVSPLVNVRQKYRQTTAIICALIGHRSQKLKDGTPIFAGLITERQGRKLRKEVPELEYKVQYAASQPRPRGRPKWVHAVPMQWIERDWRKTNLNPTGLYLASFYAITVHQKGKTQETSPDDNSQQSATVRASTIADYNSSDSKWNGGYHVYFYTMVASNEKDSGSAKEGLEGTLERKFLALSLPFEILTNPSRQKEHKWHCTVWRLGFCINDENCTTKKLYNVAPSINAFMEILTYFFRGYVNTSMGLTMIHKLCLKKYLRKFLLPRAGHVDYETFSKKFWSYCFRAMDYIRQNRFLWENHLLNYCFLDRIETEAVLLQKKCCSFLLRFQESDIAHGFPAISIILPDKSGDTPFFAHSKLQDKISIRNYTLIHCIKYAQLEVWSGEETKATPLSLKLKDFHVYGKGKCNFGRLEAEDQSSYEKTAEVRKACFEYTDERRVLFPIRVRQGDKATLSKHQEYFSQTELGKFLSYYGLGTYELMHDQIPQPQNGRVSDSSITLNSIVESYQLQNFSGSLQPVNTQNCYSPRYQNELPGNAQVTEAAYYRPCAYDTATQRSSNSFSSEPSYGPPDGAYSEEFNCMAGGDISRYDEFGQQTVAGGWSQSGYSTSSQTYASRHSSSDLVITNATFSSISGQEYTHLHPLSQQDANRQSSDANAFLTNMAFFESSATFTGSSAPVFDNGQEIRLEPVSITNGYHKLSPETVMPQQQALPVVSQEESSSGITAPDALRQQLIDWIMTTPTDQLTESMMLLGIDTANQ